MKELETTKNSRKEEEEAAAVDFQSSADKKGKGKSKEKDAAKDKGKLKHEESRGTLVEEKQANRSTKKEAKSWNPFKRSHKTERRGRNADLLETDGSSTLGVDIDQVDKLREQEIASTTDEATTVELLSVTQQSDKVNQDGALAAFGGASLSSDGGTDEVDFGGPGPEIRFPASGQVPPGDVVVTAGSGTAHEPVKPSTSVRDQVQKIQVSKEMSPPAARRSLSLSSHLR